MSLKNIARETLQILDQGYYETPPGRIDIEPARRAAVEGTMLYSPAELAGLVSNHQKTRKHEKTDFCLTSEKTQVAAHRLVQDEGVEDLVVLNFASARRVGGGFLKGAKAQEEDLARSSGLYRCLQTQPQYYDANKNASQLYTDHIIYSPRVPWFRVKNRELLARPFLASVITAPAPNAGEYLREMPNNLSQLQESLTRRAGYILAVAEANGNSTIVLGAWGCGVFRNDPEDVAAAFMTHLKSKRFRYSFRNVVFAVYDPSEPQRIFNAFQARVPH